MHRGPQARYITSCCGWSLITPGFRGTVPKNFPPSDNALGVSLATVDTLKPVLYHSTFYTVQEKNAIFIDQESVGGYPISDRHIREKQGEISSIFAFAAVAM